MKNKVFHRSTGELQLTTIFMYDLSLLFEPSDDPILFGFSFNPV
jgi:hypothetical protein